MGPVLSDSRQYRHPVGGPAGIHWTLPVDIQGRHAELVIDERLGGGRAGHSHGWAESCSCSLLPELVKCSSRDYLNSLRLFPYVLRCLDFPRYVVYVSLGLLLRTQWLPSRPLSQRPPYPSCTPALDLLPSSSLHHCRNARKPVERYFRRGRLSSPRISVVESWSGRG